jgi:hypothetical protein
VPPGKTGEILIDGEAIVEVLGLVEAAILVREADEAKALLGLSAAPATRGSILLPNRRAIANPTDLVAELRSTVREPTSVDRLDEQYRQDLLAITRDPKLDSPNRPVCPATLKALRRRSNVEPSLFDEATRTGEQTS